METNQLPSSPKNVDKNQSSSTKKKRNKLNYPTWNDLLQLLGVFLVATVVSFLLLFLLKRFGSASPGFAQFLGYCVQFGTTIIYGLYQRAKRTPRRMPLLRTKIRGVNLAITLWGLVLVAVTSVVVEPILVLFPQHYLDSIAELMGHGGWIMLTALVVAPVLEEVLFRGIVQESLTTKFGPWRGIVLGAAVFGVIHIIPQQVVNAFFVGLVLGYIYYRTRSLVPVILIHALNNALAYFSWLINGEQVLFTRDQIGNDTYYYILYGFSCVVFIVSLIAIVLRISRQEREDLADMTALQNE